MNHKRILYEDQDIIVCHKAAGIATQTSRVGQADMVSEITNYLVRSEQSNSEIQQIVVNGKTGSVVKRGGGRQNMPYVGVVHRLDQPVEGIIVFAKNRNAAADLSKQIAGKEAEKYYYAIVCGREFVQEGKLEDYLLKDGRTNSSAVVPPEVKDARRAVLHYEILAQEVFGPSAQLEEEEEGYHSESGTYRIALARIRLETGRHHQIRVQMSHAGMSLLGDYKYADVRAIEISEQMQVRTIALCAYRLAFRHPSTGERIQFQITPESQIFQMRKFYTYL